MHFPANGNEWTKKRKKRIGPEILERSGFSSLMNVDEVLVV